MSEENEGVVEKVQKFYESAEACTKAANESVRSRAYRITHPDGRQAYVLDVNPITAVGRAFAAWGHAAELIGGPASKSKDSGSLFEELQSLPEEERTKFLKMVKESHKK